MDSWFLPWKSFHVLFITSEDQNGKKITLNYKIYCDCFYEEQVLYFFFLKKRNRMTGKKKLVTTTSF